MAELWADLPIDPAFAWSLFTVLCLGCVLPVRTSGRDDHIVLAIATTVVSALVGYRALAMVWGAVVVGAALVAGWCGSWHLAGRPRLPGLRRRLMWLVASALAVSAGILAGVFVYGTLLGRSFPTEVDDLREVLAGGLGIAVAWGTLMVVRFATIRVLQGPLRYTLDPLDSELVPYLIPVMGGFPLVVASVALYRPEHPWSSLFILWWCFPLYAATALDVHRRTLARELRRDLIAQQRLAAIGEVSARIVHQSRHQVGLMGWSIHRLRGLVGRTEPEALAVTRAELDALSEAKDRLSEMLVAELLHDEDADGVDGPDTAPDDLAALVEQVADQLRAKAEDRDVGLAVGDLAVVASRSAPPRLHDALFNLLDNAIDAAHGDVTVEADCRDGSMTLRVIDDGEGIGALDPSRAFEPFYTTKSDGTGMGLAIAEAVVGDLGGDLRYVRDGGRTVFVIELPPDAVTA